MIRFGLIPKAMMMENQKPANNSHVTGNQKPVTKMLPKKALRPALYIKQPPPATKSRTEYERKNKKHTRKSAKLMLRAQLDKL